MKPNGRRRRLLQVLAGLTGVALAIGPGGGIRALGQNDPPTAPPQPGGTPATTQPQMSEKEELEQLRRRVRVLEQELDLARRTIAQLNARIAALAQGTGGDTGMGDGGAGGGDASDVTDPITLPENDAMASPEALFAAVQASLTTAMEGQQFESERERATYLRELKGWKAKEESERRGVVTWTCEATNREEKSDGGMTWTIVIRDPATGARRSEPLAIEVPRRLHAKAARIDADAKVVIKGVLRLAITINEERAEPGAFDVPKFVGPFVEFGYEFEAQSIAEVKEEDKSTRDLGPPDK